MSIVPGGYPDKRYNENDALVREAQDISERRILDRRRAFMEYFREDDSVYLDRGELRYFPSEQDVKLQKVARDRASKARARKDNALRRQETRRFWAIQLKDSVGAFLGGGAGLLVFSGVFKALGWS